MENERDKLFRKMGNSTLILDSYQEFNEVLCSIYFFWDRYNILAVKKGDLYKIHKPYGLASNWYNKEELNKIILLYGEW